MEVANMPTLAKDLQKNMFCDLYNNDETNNRRLTPAERRGKLKQFVYQILKQLRTTACAL